MEARSSNIYWKMANKLTEFLTDFRIKKNNCIEYAVRIKVLPKNCGSYFLKGIDKQDLWILKGLLIKLCLTSVVVIGLKLATLRLIGSESTKWPPERLFNFSSSKPSHTINYVMMSKRSCFLKIVNTNFRICWAIKPKNIVRKRTFFNKLK